MNTELDWFFAKENQWQDEFKEMRTIILDCGLTEELKWGKPCYTYQGNNIVLIHGFKKYCALLFHKGVLLKDEHDLLVQQTENVQSARQLRFSSTEEIREQADVIRAYVFEAIEVEKAGLKVAFKKTTEYEMPEEFKLTLKSEPDLREAFKALTPGRQRGYLLYFSQAKRSETRKSRISRCIPGILKGKGLNDRQ
ncbi:MAG: hypothetical protein HKN61_02090 [Flavobacteriaceae bacterium]|nr:hypothetical protein [Flavobacteriaceae bacterium]